MAAGVYPRIPTSPGINTGKSLVDRYNFAHNALKQLLKTARTFNTDHPQCKISIADIAGPSKDGQHESLFALAKIAAPRYASPHPNPENVKPRDFLSTLSRYQQPLKQSFQIVTWDCGHGRPPYIVLDNVTGTLWQCDQRGNKILGTQIQEIPGQIGTPREQWLESGIFFQIQPFDGKSLSHRTEDCVPTGYEMFLAELDSKNPALIEAWNLVMGLVPFPAFSVVGTGSRGPHTIFVIEPHEKEALKRTLGMLLKFLGNDHTGWNSCKLTRLPNCGRGEAGEIQILEWYSPVPSALSPQCQTQSVAEFAALVYKAAEQNQKTIEVEIMAMEMAYKELRLRWQAAKTMLPATEIKAKKRGRKASAVGKENKSPDMEARMMVGAEVMKEFRRRLGAQLRKCPKNGKLDINSVPGSMINTVARAYDLDPRSEINFREIKRCLQNVCDTPHREIRSGLPSRFANLDDREFHSPLNCVYLGGRWAEKDPWRRMQVNEDVYAEFAFVARIISARTLSSQEYLSLPNERTWKREKVSEYLGAVATAGEVFEFLEVFWNSRPMTPRVGLPGKDEPSERVILAARKAFKCATQTDGEGRLATDATVNRRRVGPKKEANVRVDNFVRAWKRNGAEESDLDELLMTMEKLLKAVGWDIWVWIKEDLFRLEMKYWDWDALAKCGAAAKAIIRQAVEAIALERAGRKQHSPFIFTEDVYAQIQKHGHLARIESHVPGPAKETDAEKASRRREGVMMKIRRGLRELGDLVSEVGKRASAKPRKSVYFAKFRLHEVVLKPPISTTCIDIVESHPTYIASIKLNSPLGLENTPQLPENQNHCSAPVACHTSIPLENSAVEANTTVQAPVTEVEQSVKTHNNAPESKEVVQTTASTPTTDQTAGGIAKTDGELPLDGGTEGRRKGKVVKNKAGHSTYSIKVDSESGDVMLGKQARGKNSTKTVNGCKQRQLNAIVTRQEIPVIVKAVKAARFGRVSVTGLAALTEELASKVTTTDLIQGKDGTRFIKVKFFIKAPRGLLQNKESNFVLQTDAQVHTLRVHGREFVPCWNEKETKSAHWYMTGVVEIIESAEIGTIFSHWDMVAANKLWNWEASKAAAAKA